MFHKKVVHAPVRPFSSIREMLSLAVTEDGNKIAYKFKQKDGSIAEVSYRRFYNTV